MASRLFVGNLSYDATEEELTVHFEQAGPVSRVFIPLDRETGRPRGFAFIEFEDASHASHAISLLNQKPFKDRPLVVNEARPSEARPPGPSRPLAPRGVERPSGDRMSGAPPRSPRPPSSRPFDSESGEGKTVTRRTGAKPRRKGGKRASWDDGPKKAPIPEKRQSRLLSGFDDEDEESVDVEFDDFATSLPDDEAEESVDVELDDFATSLPDDEE